MPSSPSRATDPLEPGRGTLIHVPAEAAGLLAPSLCACCLEPAGMPQRLEAAGGPTMVVHYCDECHAHASGGRTRWLAVAFASALVGLATAAALVLGFDFLKVPVQAALAGFAALLPALALLRPRPPQPPHTARGPAAWWRRNKSGGWTLACTNPDWATRIATSNDARSETLGARPIPFPWPIVASSLLGVLGVPAAHAALGVDVRVLNRHASPAVVVVDGRHRGIVHPSSAESSAAGLQLRLIAGRRHFLLISREGSILEDSTATLRPGADHLLASSPDSVCFWLERDVYGRSKAHEPTRELLEGSGPLWVLPGVIDSWFAPNPPSDESDTLSSGGVLLALRQGRCHETAD